jgi:hypothetical protein
LKVHFFHDLTPILAVSAIPPAWLIRSFSPSDPAIAAVHAEKATAAGPTG